MIRDAPVSAESLAATELFRGLRSRALEVVAASARLQRFAKDSLIFNQGDGEVRAHSVVDGAVRIAQSGSDGAQVVMRYIGPGEMFGTVSLFTDGRYPADAVAVCDTQVASWSEPELLALMRGHPQIAINVIGIIGKRLQEAQERMRELATQPAERRVAHAVLRLAEQVGHSTTDGTAIEFSLRRKDIADIAGTTLHTASRILTAWQNAGWLASRKQRLTVRNPTEIRRIAVSSAD